MKKDCISLALDLKEEYYNNLLDPSETVINQEENL